MAVYKFTLIDLLNESHCLLLYLQLL